MWHSHASRPTATLHCNAGVITTLVTREHVPDLQDLAQELKLELVKVTEPVVEPLQSPEGDSHNAAADVDKAKQGLEDIFNLY